MAKKWKRLERIVKLKSRWITVFADKLLDHEGNELEYWHFDRADSVIVIPLQKENILFPPKIYRVGIDKVTLDLPGGRIDESLGAEATARHILQKELGITNSQIVEVSKLNELPYSVDSSFSSQKLHIYTANIAPAKLQDNILSYSTSNFSDVFAQLNCAQCRLALHEYLAVYG